MYPEGPLVRPRTATAPNYQAPTDPPVAAQYGERRRRPVRNGGLVRQECTMTVTTLTSREQFEAEYIDRINQAVAEDRFDLVDDLAREYEREVLVRVQAA
jgi:hypothetical protein